MGFLLFMCLSIPIISVINEILSVWLVNPPQYSSILCVLSLLYVQFNSLCGTLQNIIQATGEVRNFQIASGTLKTIAIPIVCLLYYIGYPVESYLWVLITFAFLSLFIELFFVKLQVPIFSIKRYLSQVVVRDLLSLFIPLILGLYFMNQSYEIKTAAFIIIIMLLLCILSSWMIGFTKSERIWVKEVVFGKLINN